MGDMLLAASMGRGVWTLQGSEVLLLTQASSLQVLGSSGNDAGRRGSPERR